MKIVLLLLLSSFPLFSNDLPYVNWENHPVRALDISADKKRMAIAHTADNRVQLFDISLGYPVRLGHVKVGVDPVSVRFRDNNELWVVNHISDSVSIVDFDKKQVIQTLQTNDEPFDVVFANFKAFVSCSQANQIMVFDSRNLSQSVTVIDVMAEDPRAMTVNNDGSKVYVASFESGNKTTILAGGIAEGDGVLGFPGNPVNREPSPYQGQNPPPNDGDDFLPAMNSELPTPPKVSLIIRQSEDGRWLDDNGEDWTHMVSGEQANLSGRIPGWSLLDHDITVIDTATNEVSYISGLMNIGMAIGFNAAKNQVTLVGTDAINEVRFEPILNGIFVRAKLGIVSSNDLNNPIVTDLNPHLDYLTSSEAQNMRDKSIGNPRGIVWNSSGDRAYVTGMGSNNVVVIDANGARIDEIEVGQGATGIGLDEDNNRLYVWNHFAASLSVVDTTSGNEITQVQLFNPLPESIKQGRKFLYDSHLTSGLGQASCASCHVDARMDRLAWDLGDPSGEMKQFNQNCQTEISGISNFNCDDFHPMKGPMMTQTFQDIIGHEPFHWRGDRDGIEEFNGAFQSINGDDTQLTADEMAKFKAMLASITFPPNPFRNLDNTLPESIELKNHYTSGRFATAGQPLGAGNPQNGLQLFNLGLLDGVFQCGSCHTVPTGMAVNGQLKLGTINAGVGGQIMPHGEFDSDHLGIVSVDGSTQKSIKTPQLRNMYEKVGFETSRLESLAGFGFLHDGAIDSITRFLSAPAFSVNSDQELADLVALMMAFSGSELDNGFIPLGNDPEESLDTHAGVGKQYTLTQATQLNDDINELVAIAGSGKVDLIVNATDGSNYLFNASTNKFSTQTGEELTTDGLMSLASSQNSLNYTLVPQGLGSRLVFDRDGDGVFDYQEIINGSNLTDASSIQIRPTTGLWYNPERSGHGIDVQILGNNLFILWYTYNDDGTPTWYLASAAYSPNWQADLYSFTWNDVNREPIGTIVGTVALDFNNAKSAQFSWDIAGRKGSEPFQVFNVSNQQTIQQYTGAYYDSSDSGWGLTVYTQGVVQVSVVYYYDENNMPRWALGTSQTQNQAQVELLSFNGFCPDCQLVDTTNTAVGSLSFLATTSAIDDHALLFSTELNYSDEQVGSWIINNANLTSLSDAYFNPALQ